MADPILDEISLTTQKEILPNALQDNFFLDMPLLSFLRAKSFLPFTGGDDMQSVFLYAPLNGGAYASGDNFNITKPQTLAGTRFDPRLYEVSVVEFKEELLIHNKGPLAVYSLLDVDMRNAIQTISAIIGVAMHQHGQASGGAVGTDRSKQLNGWAEAINDGVTSSWQGDEFTTYGTQTRNGAISAALNSIPYWAGDQSGNALDVTYDVLEKRYQRASRGRVEPDLGVCNKELFSAIKSRIQVQQRFDQIQDPYWGVSGLKMNSAIIMKDDYFPSKVDGKNEAVLGNYLTSSFTSASSPDSNSNMPSSTTLQASEVFVWFNTSSMKFRISNSEEFGFGFTGFVPAQDNTRVVGQVKAAVNVQFQAPWANQQIFGLK
jgi:hypothetical protein|tara:strand:- start:12074 stop:13201 length:1128 start_codon:yes stop_codon:yes gene_type:complete